MVGPTLGTLTGHSPPVRTFGEHFLFVVADDFRTASGHKRRITGQRPRPEMPRRHGPIGQASHRELEVSAGYYAEDRRSWSEEGLGSWDGVERRPRSGRMGVERG